MAISCFTLKVSCHGRSERSDDFQQSNSPLVEVMPPLLLPPSSPLLPYQERPSSLLHPSQEHVASLSPGRASCSSSSSASPLPLDCFPLPHSPSPLVFLACKNHQITSILILNPEYLAPGRRWPLGQACRAATHTHCSAWTSYPRNLIFWV